MLSRAVCFAALVIVAACNPSHETDSGVGAPEPGPLGKAFQASAARANVPRDLLVAIAQVEGGLAVPAHRTVETDATVPAAGPLMLRRGRWDTLRRAAELSGETELALREQGDVALALQSPHGGRSANEISRFRLCCRVRMIMRIHPIYWLKIGMIRS